MAEGFVVGVDVGGTRTRAVAVDHAGRGLGAGLADGANPNAHPVPVAAARIADAVQAALAGVDPAGCLGCVLGLAGASRLADPTVSEAVHAALRSTGLRCAITVRPDTEVAFAAGTARPDGVVLIAGTGSIAAGIADRRTVLTSGGFGWLLGDEGSAFWIGREAVRGTLRALQAAQEPGPLGRAVLAATGSTGYRELITAVHALPPVHLAELAPLVSANADDPVAAGVLDAAAAHLVGQVRMISDGGQLVIAGSVAAPGTPVGLRLPELLPDHEVSYAADASAGAAWLAALDAFGPTAPWPQG